MKIIKINPEQPENEAILEAVKILKSGGVIVYPTETLYGLGSNAFDKKAVKRVFEIKSREKKPIAVAAKNLKDAKKLVEFNSLAIKIAKRFLPGPLTMILPLKDKRLEPLSIGTKNLGIRIPDNIVTQKILKFCSFPITTTSANISGGNNPVNAEDAINQIGERVDLILDAGKCELGQPSTIISTTNNEIKIIRKGAIPEEEILKIK